MPSLRELVDACIAELSANRDIWKGHCQKAERELADAKAEIERLRKQRDEWAEKAIAQANAGTLFVVPNQEFEADVEIGRLVRGMALGTRLSKNEVQVSPCAMQICYWTERKNWGHTWSLTERQYLKDSPAKALRAIQEVGDAEV